MASDICVQVGKRIRYLRAKQGWTQTMLADHAGLSREHISELENGRKEIGLRSLKKIALALDINLQRFFEGI